MVPGPEDGRAYLYRDGLRGRDGEDGDLVSGDGEGGGEEVIIVSQMV